MNHHINPCESGLAVGALFGGLHVVWSILIALGWAQALINFIFWAHMLRLPLAANPFDLSAAITLIVVSSFVGYVVGYAFASIWNRLNHR